MERTEIYYEIRLRLRDGSGGELISERWATDEGEATAAALRELPEDVRLKWELASWRETEPWTEVEPEIRITGGGEGE